MHTDCTHPGTHSNLLAQHQEDVEQHGVGEREVHVQREPPDENKVLQPGLRHQSREQTCTEGRKHTFMGRGDSI